MGTQHQCAGRGAILGLFVFEARLTLARLSKPPGKCAVGNVSDGKAACYEYVLLVYAACPRYPVAGDARAYPHFLWISLGAGAGLMR